MLEGRFNRSRTASWLCTRKADWHIVYLSFRQVLSPICLCDELLVHYDAAKNTCASLCCPCPTLCARVCCHRNRLPQMHRPWAKAAAHSCPGALWLSCCTGYRHSHTHHAETLLCRYSNQQGVEIRPYDFGGLNGVVALDPDAIHLTSTFRPLAMALKFAGALSISTFHLSGC